VAKFPVVGNPENGDHQRPVERPRCPRLERPPVWQIEMCRNACLGVAWSDLVWRARFKFGHQLG